MSMPKRMHRGFTLSGRPLSEFSDLELHQLYIHLLEKLEYQKSKCGFGKQFKFERRTRNRAQRTIQRIEAEISMRGSINATL
jgi:hypothetical protein